MSQDSHDRIAADILIARLSSGASSKTAKEIADDFQVIFDQVKYCNELSIKPPKRPLAG